VARHGLRILALEAYYGGSHRAFLDTLVGHSRHEFTVMTLPARKWKWRMRGSAIWFAQEIAKRASQAPDLILTTDMVSVTDLKSLLVGGVRELPVVCYFHENQLTYPLPNEADRDFQYGFTNITSCLASDAVWFNSRFHLDDFVEGVARLLRKMPDYVPEGIGDELKRRATVKYPLVEMDAIRAAATATGRPEQPLRILWNHRWEYDKNPEAFFEAVIGLAQAGHDFRLVVVGETFRQAPKAFASSWRALRGKIEQTGYIASRPDYLAALAGCHVVVSTSIQENFGIAVVEAMVAGCRPLLPDRLSYPELIPERFHATCLYHDVGELQSRLAELIGAGGGAGIAGLEASVFERFSVERNIETFDRAFEAVLEASPSRYVAP